MSERVRGGMSERIQSGLNERVREECYVLSVRI